MNNWIKRGLVGITLASATLSAMAEEKPQNANPNASQDLKQGEGSLHIDALDYAGGSKLKDRIVAVAGKSVEFATIQQS